jgi:Zn-dependent protease with chaperone function
LALISSMCWNVLFLFIAGSLAAALVFVANWFALIPWRRVKEQHWTERARLVYPVRATAEADLWAIPAMLTFAGVLFWPETSPPWGLVAIAAALGTRVGTLPLVHEVFPRIMARDLFRQAACACLMQLLIWFVFIGAMVLMPDELNLQAAMIGGGVLVLWEVWNRAGIVWVGRRIGLVTAAPERLKRIMGDTAAKMNVPFREVFLMRVSWGRAGVFPASRKLLFSERLLELLPDEEVAAVCTHELGHLSESKAVRFRQSMDMLAFMPWLFFRPLVHAFGPPAFLGLLITTFAVLRLSGTMSRKLEARADRIAVDQEADPGTYARALLRLYEDGLVPAVLEKKEQKHPDLFDRLLAAGVTPDFPRPAAPSSIVWYGIVFIGALALMIFIFITRMR